MNIFTYLSSSWYLGRIEKIYSRIRLDFLSHIHTDVSTLDLIDIYFTKELKTVFVLKILLPVLFWPHTRVTPLADNTVIYSRRSRPVPQLHRMRHGIGLLEKDFFLHGLHRSVSMQ